MKIMSLKQPNKIRVNHSDLERYGETAEEIYAYNGKLFSGYAVLDRFQNGDIEYEIEYKNGKHYGWENEYYPNGQIKDETLTCLETSLEFYEYDENGNQTGGGKVVSEDYYQDRVNTYKLLD